ncbi:hypothetical protein ACFOD9_08895 [Novosphingobium bradum]|uniref:Uncharacterized protein n=1 Tax=Novosphingobium bradum TaxID=1737444 RepID=A0ABV7IUF8_9SPHN
MSEFMLILPGAGTPPGSASPRPLVADDPQAIARNLESCLAALDRIEAGVSAAYLSMAIDQLRIQFNLARDGSGTD